MSRAASASLRASAPARMPLGQQPAARPDADAALRLARRTFLAGERVDMQALALRLGVDRTTLFRWVGNRDQLLGDVMWSLAEPTFQAAQERMTHTGALGVAEVLGHFAQDLIDAPSLGAFLRREPERALRLLTTKASVLQRKVVGCVEQLLQQEVDRGNLSHALVVHDLAYLVVRIAETFIYTDLITDEPPDACKAETAIAAVLGAAGRLPASGPPAPRRMPRHSS